jgi:H+-translocating NAD(P) transhydrogenase subunit beta
MPQLVSLFNAVGGGAAALIAIDEYIRLVNAAEAAPLTTTIFVVLDILIGSITFSGSLIASGKLMGLKITPSRPVRIPGGQLVTLGLAIIVVAGSIYLFLGNESLPVMLLILAASLVFGITMTLPIGGADMPVVISLLNSFTGTAVAMAGFVLDNVVLIIAGALVGASGAILSVRRDPDQAHGRRDEPLGDEHHDRRLRGRRRRGGRGRRGWNRSLGRT